MTARIVRLAEEHVEGFRDALRHAACWASACAPPTAAEGLCRRHMRVHGEYYDSWLMAWLA